MDSKSLIARRPFWFKNENGQRTMVNRGETFKTNNYHAEQLIKNRIANLAPEVAKAAPGPSNVQTQGPSNTQDMKPQETKIEPIIANNSEAAPDIPSNPEPLPDDYNELKALAKAAGIPKYNTMKKSELKTKLIQKGAK